MNKLIFWFCVGVILASVGDIIIEYIPGIGALLCFIGGFMIGWNGTAIIMKKSKL